MKTVTLIYFFLVSCVSSVWHKYTSCTLISETQHVTGDKVVFYLQEDFCMQWPNSLSCCSLSLITLHHHSQHPPGHT
uniref:Putative secreted protein n=1 Tax=Amblyomma triste TaxID=251400 RepID=A0A023G302_AMBTT